MAADLLDKREEATVNFEVETKFRLPANFKEILETKGARLLRDTTFTDVYFDAPNHELTLAGYWLRKRGDKWELKIQNLRDYRCGIESNTEIEDEKQIVTKLSRRLTGGRQSKSGEISSCSVEEFIHRTSCKQLACFNTQRTVYAMPNKVTIDLDQTNFGYQVGELELVVSSERDIILAQETIRKTASILGM